MKQIKITYKQFFLLMVSEFSLPNVTRNIVKNNPKVKKKNNCILQPSHMRKGYLQEIYIEQILLYFTIAVFGF